MKKLSHYFLLAIGIILLDQFTKYLTYINRYDLPVSVFGDWFKISYVLNPGMAFGASFGGVYGKLFLTLFRVVAVIFIGIYLKKLYKEKIAPKGFLVTISMIFAGAIGNTIDSLIYGTFNDKDLLVNNAPIKPLYGKVIDMFHIDLFITPSWLPVFANYPLWPVFNVADASIFIAVCTIIIFQKRFLVNK